MEKIFIFIKQNLKKSIYIAIGIIVFGFLSIYFLGWYGDWKFNRDLEIIKGEMERPYLEDTYGGKTPKETLKMFITAIEKEDFDLASKYFVIERQEEWRIELIEIKNANKMQEFLKPILNEIDSLELKEPKLETQENYISGSMVLFEFVKYPQGNWKIKEI